MARRWSHIPSYQKDGLDEFWSSRDATELTYKISPTRRYEPFFIGYKPDLPQLFEYFRGFGLDKQSFVRECILKGFELEGQYQLYLTHLAHTSNINNDIRALNAKRWNKQFGPHLRQNYQVPDHLLKKTNGDADVWYNVP